MSYIQLLLSTFQLFFKISFIENNCKYYLSLVEHILIGISFVIRKQKIFHGLKI